MNNKKLYCEKCMRTLTMNDENCPFCGHETKNKKHLNLTLKNGFCLNKRYIINEILTQDEKTITYLGLDKHLESKIAILELFPKKIVSRLEAKIFVKKFDYEKIFQEIKNNFLNVYKILINLRILPNILKVYGVFEENNTIYVIQEIPKGTTFKKYLENNYGELSWIESKQMFLDLIKLLKHIHSRNILHLNLTPNNLIVYNNNLKIIDFNFAVLKNKINYNNFKLNDGYSALEQYDKSLKIGTYTDVYSLAAIIYKTLTGTKPVNSTSRLSSDNLLPANVLNSKTPKNVSIAIDSALILSPKLRTQTMGDFFEDLNAITREKRKILELENQKKVKNKPKLKKRKEKTTGLVVKSLLISCGIASFFMVIIIFFIFGKNLFE